MYIGGAGNIDLVLFRDGSTSVTYDLFRLVYRHESATNYNSGTSEYRTSLLDGGERDRVKVWRRIGAVFASPEQRGNPSSIAPVTLILSYSTDGGRSWTTAATSLVTDPQQRTSEITTQFTSGQVVGRFVQLRVSFSNVVDWSPALVGLWADYEVIDAIPRRRRWNLKIRSRDHTVRRDGSVEPRTGRTISSDLWDAWTDSATIPFTDLDFAATGLTHQVRIASISEVIPVPADAASWGDSVVSLVVIEV